MVLVSVNLTALSHVRLDAVFSLPIIADAHVVLLQETRHDRTGAAWVGRAVAPCGWCVQVSPPPSPDRLGCSRARGTMLLWRASLGRSSCVDFSQLSEPSRVTGRRWAWGSVVLVCFYGPADRTDPALLASTVRAAARSDHAPVCW